MYKHNPLIFLVVTYLQVGVMYEGLLLVMLLMVEEEPLQLVFTRRRCIDISRG